jgi:site-specific recombinase XerD
MKKKVYLKRIYHRDRWRLALIFDFDTRLKEKVRMIPGCTFSATHRCYYVDDNEENLRIIFSTLKGDADIDISEIAWKSSHQEEDRNQSVGTDGGKTEYSIIKNKDLTDVGGNGIPESEMISGGDGGRQFPDGESKTKGKYGAVQFRIDEKAGLLVIRFLGRYDSGWIREMKSYGDLRFEKKHLEWLLSWSKQTVDSLADYFAGQGVSVNVVRQSVPEELLSKRKATGDEIRSRQLIDKGREGLDLMECFLDDNRYSPRTRESYMAMLEFFFRYFSPRDPDEISEGEISRFLYDYIIQLGYSAAYQNQMVSAIKTYYTITGKGLVRPELLARPRRARALPKVFSKEEVSLILNSSRNMKHKLILWMIYSCGLRRSEVTNIKLTDLDRERGILHIREGKGNVDRIVPMPGKVWQKVDEYLGGYRPKVYLFEGQTGGRYSSESVYRIFKEALVSAGIKKDVGVHSLRHSYATHLHENGLDIRYIQELLGHRSSRTTEIYTHVSRRNLVGIRSPIEDLDLK